jgi:hypothetical protein
MSTVNDPLMRCVLALPRVDQSVIKLYLNRMGVEHSWRGRFAFNWLSHTNDFTHLFIELERDRIVKRKFRKFKRRLLRRVHALKGLGPAAPSVWAEACELLRRDAWRDNNRLVARIRSRHY